MSNQDTDKVRMPSGEREASRAEDGLASPEARQNGDPTPDTAIPAPESNAVDGVDSPMLEAEGAAEGGKPARSPRPVRILSGAAAPTGSEAEAPGREPVGPGATRRPVSGAAGTGPAATISKIQTFQPHLRHEQIVKGSHPGDTYIRYGRTVGAFRRKGGGILAASLAADQPRSAFGRLFNRVKRALIGSPISTEHSIHERLTNIKALAVLSSDALSSVAYATEEILRILLLAGTAALTFSIPIAGAVILLMIIVVASYRQTIAAYPRGGGTYIVAKDNLGTLPGLAAASSILIGYILTVAVSVAAGVAALYSIFPSLHDLRVPIALAIIVFITIANLRGLREAGNIFAVPTYLFIVGILIMIAYGVFRDITGFGGALDYIRPPTTDLDEIATLQGVTLLLILRAFTQGSAALTGVEAIADGVPAFKPPEANNARKTLFLMAAISIVMFAGITYLAARMQILPSHDETVVSQVARTVFGRNGVWFYIQVVTALILVLAANTAFADFPRLSYFLARDKFMPHQYSFRGDRLAFSWGIVTLAALACILIWAYDGNTSALIPLYAIGVMGAFTFSQAGMVVRWWRTRPRGWQRNMLMNGIGATVTLTVFLVATLTKLDQGTWIVIVIIPIEMALFLGINRHYRHFATQVEAVTPLDSTTIKHTVIVPVANLNPVVRSALAYARSITPDATAVHVAEGEDTEEVERFNKEWHEVMGATDIPLVIIESPYRSLIGPLLSYIDALDQQRPDDTITIVLPELLPSKPWEYFLHNQSALRLKAALLFRPNTVVASMPYVHRRAIAPAPGGDGKPS